MTLPLAISPGDAGHIDDHEEIHDLLSSLDGQTAWKVTGWRQGLLAARPAAAASNQGLFYFATDGPALYYSDGSAWRQQLQVTAANTFTAVQNFEDDTFFSSGRPWADVMADEWGATGDAVTNDTQAIRDAVLSGAADIYFPDPPGGFYSIDPDIAGSVNGLEPQTGQRWIGSKGAILKARAQAFATATRIINIESVSNVTIEGITLDGNKGAGGWSAGVVLGFSVRSSSDIKLIDCVAHDVSGGDGFYLGDAGAGTRCARVDLVRCRSYDNGRQGISVVHAEETTLQNCRSSGNAMGGFDLEPGGGESLSDITLEGCRAWDNTDDGIVIANAAIDGVKLSVCVSWDNGGQGFNSSLASNLAFVGCTAYSNTAEGFFFSSVVGFELQGCRSDENTYGFRMSNNCTDGKVVGGIAEANTNDGLLIQSGVTKSGASGLFTAKNNTGSGINIAGTENTIEGCISYGNGQRGIDVANATRCSVRGNSVYANSQSAHNTYDGIRLQSTSVDNQITGNKVFRGSGGAQQRYGLRIEGGATTTGTLAIFNDLENGGATAAYSDAGTATEVNLDGSANNWNRT